MKTTLLYLHKIKRRHPDKTSCHSHDFWQLEVVTGGRIDAVIKGNDIVLNTSDMLLVRPDIDHGFIYGEHDISWITLKFITSEIIETDDYTVIRHSPFSGRLLTSLESLIHSTIMEDYEKKAIEGHIEAIFDFVQSKDFNKPTDRKNMVIEDISAFVRSRNGKPVTINELSDKFSYSRSHISKEFKRQTGQSLKEYIDKIRLEKSREMLSYSDFSISQIAFELGFKDIYSFSRFFKKHTTYCPRTYRAD